jgi:hypothetical protein
MYWARELTIRSYRHTGYADLAGGGNLNGTTIQAWSNVANNNQLWLFVSADPFGRVFM